MPTLENNSFLRLVSTAARPATIEKRPHQPCGCVERLARLANGGYYDHGIRAASSDRRALIAVIAATTGLSFYPWASGHNRPFLLQARAGDALLSLLFFTMTLNGQSSVGMAHKLLGLRR